MGKPWNGKLFLIKLSPKHRGILTCAFASRARQAENIHDYTPKKVDIPFYADRAVSFSTRYGGEVAPPGPHISIEVLGVILKLSSLFTR